MESITQMGLDLDNMELDQHLIEEDQLLERKQEDELVQQELLQGLELTILIQIRLISEVVDLEMHLEMEGIRSVILQDQDSIKALDSLEKTVLNMQLEEDIIYHRV